MPDPNDIPYVSTVKRLTNIDEIRNVPVIGGLYGAGNTVIDYFESDCHPDWYVYAETLFPALGEAVLVLLSFGLDDVLRGYFRPAGGRGFGGLGRASRRVRRPTRAQLARGQLKGGIPEVGELIGRNLPGAEIVRARQITQAEKMLWKVDGLAQRGLWYWMIADILDDFTVNWTTALYSSVDCIGLEVGGFSRTTDGTYAVGLGFASMPCDILLDQWGPVSSTARQFVIPAGYQGSVALQASCGIEHPATNGWTPTIRRLGALGPNAVGQPATLNPETGLWEMGVTLKVYDGGTFEWGVNFPTFGWIFSNDATITGALTKTPG